jgi:4-aminobutyrate--pyruvate transaminase
MRVFPRVARAPNLFHSQVADVIADGSEGGLFGHGYTFGGHPVACAVAVECLDIYKEQGILSNTRARSDQLLGGLKEVAKGSGICGELRGKML